MGKRKDKHVIEQVRRRKLTWAGHVSRIRDEITDRHCVPPPGNHTKEKDIEEDRRDVVEIKIDYYWNGTISQRIAQDRQMWKQHAEAG